MPYRIYWVCPDKKSLALRASVLRMEVEEGLGFDHCDLVGERMESVNVDFVAAGFEIDIAERLQAAGGKFRERDKHAAIACESVQVQMALAVEISTHFLDLKIGHIAQSTAQGAFVGSLAAELESLDKTASGQ